MKAEKSRSALIMGAFTRWDSKEVNPEAKFVYSLPSNVDVGLSFEYIGYCERSTNDFAM